MKKLIAFLFFLNVSVLSQAQEDWSKLTEVFDEVYSSAKSLEDLDSRVSARMNTISIATNNGVVSLQRISKSNQNAFRVSSTSTGKSIPLDKMNSERVVESFQIKLLELQANSPLLALSSGDEEEEVGALSSENLEVRSGPSLAVGRSAIAFTKHDDISADEFNSYYDSGNQDADV